jgi:hypothetical protein
VNRRKDLARATELLGGDHHAAPPLERGLILAEAAAYAVVAIAAALGEISETLRKANR